jgi:two-component system OmpR family response regulator
MKPNRILLIDDEKHIVDVVVYALEESGFAVLTAMDGDRGLQRFREEAPDLVILDLMLPGMSGLDLFREMRIRRRDVPVIMLSSRSEEIDRVLGLEMGADDYVTKPFSPRELVARVKCVLRRAGGGNAPTPDRTLTCGPLVVDPGASTLHFFGRRLALTRGEFRLMEGLARYPARVFTRDDLVGRIYEGEHPVTDRSIDAYVKRVRRKFAEIAADMDPIETVHGFGYKLNQRLEDVPASEV